jgi:thiamine transport system ATP-binding protein
MVGPSGSGKSSLLAAIVGIVQPTLGTVMWDGVDLAETPVHERGFGLVFQDGQLFPHLSVAKNIAYGLAAKRVPKAERREVVDRLLGLVDLAGYGERAVGTLSGGQRQRVALARSLAPEPRLLCLDEPLASLDTTMRRELGQAVADIMAATQVAAILVTHDMDEARLIGHRVVHMTNGTLTDGAQ